MTRRDCKDCKHRSITSEGEYYCKPYKVWRREDSKQISFMTMDSDVLCDFEPIVVNMGKTYEQEEMQT
jgi:hypothetical protein